ncbi:AAA family ATPase [Bradyrhizobium sp. LHD-71]|uniref:AAA family ATPase n=1 Tax=Bradyrhizobium sp. LHD-71 TaxID=3072141 RepID=UPI00280DAAC2|nr:AAA family ATPase [Bradyrhizobium sp. LHD-71]MDQ8730718.1 AAA family ATPase [Bradyrhizobium sp. LHD-71]
MMKIREVAIAGYRSLRAIRFPVGQLTVFVGANGVGKTNLYRALQLLQASAAGTLSRELASEGGMQSALWAGQRKVNKPVRIKLSVELGAETERSGQSRFDYGVEVGVVHSYEIDIGLRTPTAAAFALEPQVKEEMLVFRGAKRPLTVLERKGTRATAIDNDGRKHTLSTGLLASETALGGLRDPGRFGDIEFVRQTMLDWRFYHDFRSDRDAPLRRPCLAVTTPTLASDGGDLAAVFATLVHIREDAHELHQVIDDAFPGARLVVPSPDRTASFGLIQAEYPQRVFEANELSDGTLRYLALAGALLGYRLPGFIALNEPEASLHPDLLEPLARLIVRAAERTQVWVVTHSERLAAAFASVGGVTPRTVVKRKGETWIDGLKLSGSFAQDDDDEDADD